MNLAKEDVECGVTMQAFSFKCEQRNFNICEQSIRSVCYEKS